MYKIYQVFFSHTSSAILALLANVVVAQEHCESDFSFSSDAEETVAEAYLAYYARPPDLQGLSFWSGQLSAAQGNLNEIMDEFATSDEYLERYGELTNRELVAALYRQVFGREGAPTEIARFAANIDAGRIQPAAAALEMLATATGEDAEVVEYRLSAAAYFVDCMRQYGSLEAAYDNIHDPAFSPIVANIASVTNSNTYAQSLIVFDALIDLPDNQPPIAVISLIPPNMTKNAVHSIDLPGYDPDGDPLRFELADLGLLESGCEEMRADQNLGWSHLCLDNLSGRLYLESDGSGEPIEIRYRVISDVNGIDENVVISLGSYADEDDPGDNEQRPGEMVGTDINGFSVYDLTREGIVFIPNQNHIGTAERPRIEIYDGGQLDIIYPGCAGQAPYGLIGRRDCEDSLEFVENIVYAQRLSVNADTAKAIVEFQSGGIGSDHRVFDYSISTAPGDFNQNTAVCLVMERGNAGFDITPNGLCALEPYTTYFANMRVSGEATQGPQGGPEDCGQNYRCRVVLKAW